MDKFKYKIPPEASGEALAILVHLDSIRYMMQVCLRDREEYWVQRYTDEKIKMNAFHDEVVRKYYNPADFDINDVIVHPSVHWMSDVLEITVDNLTNIKNWNPK